MRLASSADCESNSQSSQNARIDVGVAIERLENGRPAIAGLDAQRGGIELRQPGEVAYLRGFRGGIGAIVVVQDVEHRAVEVSRLRADVVAGAVVDLVEQFFLGEFGIRLRCADSTEQRGLAIVQRKAVRREHGAGRIVPAEHGGGELQVEGVAESRA